MRSFLPNLNICGGVGVWSEGKICRYAIDSLLSFCDTVVIMMDNSDDKTRKIVEEYAQKYSEKIIIGNTGLPLVLPGEGIMQRQKKYEGQIIQCAFDLIKTVHEKKPIDILVFIDSDEKFTNNLPRMMEKFWTSNRDTVFIKPIEVYESPYIIVNKGLVSHAKIYKYVPEISSVPYSKQNYYLPYRKNRRILKESWNFVHLARLTDENRKLRNIARQRTTDEEVKLRRVSKKAWELTPGEAEKVSLSPNFIKLKDWNGNIESVPLIL